MKIEKIVASNKGDFMALDTNGDAYILIYFISQETGKSYGEKIYRWKKIEEPTESGKK